MSTTETNARTGAPNHPDGAHALSGPLQAAVECVHALQAQAAGDLATLRERGLRAARVSLDELLQEGVA